MSTLGFKNEGDQPEQGDKDRETSSEDDLSKFNIDNAETNSVEDSETVPEKSASTEEIPEETTDQPLETPPLETAPPADVPSDASYLLDSDFSDFTVDEKLISNYRSSMAEKESAEQEQSEQPSEPEAPAPDQEAEPEPSMPSSEAGDQSQATFYLVDLYRSQGMLERALKVLETLKTLDVDQERITREQREIRLLLGEDVPPEEPAKEEVPPESPLPTEPEPESSPEEKTPAEPTVAEVPVEAPATEAEPEIAEKVEPDTTPEAVTEPPSPEESAEARQLAEEEHERKRVEALKRRMSGETVTDEPADDEEGKVAPEEEDDAEQRRIAALMARAGSATDASVPEQPAEETADTESDTDQSFTWEHAGPDESVDQEEPDIPPEKESETVETVEPEVTETPEMDTGEAEAEELARIARLKERSGPLPEPETPPEPRTETDEKKWWDNWLYLSGAVVIALIAAWLFWPASQPPEQIAAPEITQLAPEQQPEITADQPVVVIDTVVDERQAVTEALSEPVEMDLGEAPVEEITEPEPAKPVPEIKTLPMRNLTVNQQALDLFKNGNYWAAATIWGQEKKQHPAHFSIILLFGCEESTIKNAYRQLDEPDDFFLLPRYIKDRQCYTICWGDFTSLNDARQWFDEVPSWFADNGAKPMIRSFSKMRTTATRREPVRKAATIIPVKTAEPVIEEVAVEQIPVIPATPETDESEVLTIAEPEAPVIDEQYYEVDTLDKVTTVEEAFMAAMITLPQAEAVVDTPQLEETPLPEEPEDSTIIVIETDRVDDWIEMDTTTLALEPEAEATGEEFVDIADLEEPVPFTPEPDTASEPEIEMEPEPEPEPEPVPDYTPKDLLQLGRFMEAAGIWEIQKGAEPNNYTIKLLVACQEGSINDAYRTLNQADDFFILPKTLDGKACYAVCWGDFVSKRDVKRRLKEVPKWFKRNSGKPEMTTFAKIFE